MLPGMKIDVGPEAVVVAADCALTVLSSAVVGGGLASARTIVNVHVPKNFPCDDADGIVGAFVRRHGLPEPHVGLLTSAWTERAETATASADGTSVVALVTVGLGNLATAGRTRAAPPTASTINTIVLLDAAPDPAAMVNVVITATEVKTRALSEFGLRSPDGSPSTGTSTDAVVVAATGRGRPYRFGGPVSELGWLAARAGDSALGAGVRAWLTVHS